MSDPVTVSPADYDGLARFLAAFPGETQGPSFWLARFGLWWDWNPAFTEKQERGWLLRRGGAIAGFCGAIPVWFQREGREEVAVTATTWRVLPESRSEGLRLFFKLLQTAKDRAVFCTTPSETTAAVLQALKFTPLRQADERRSVVVLNAGHVAEARLGRYPGGALVAKAAAGALALRQALWLRLPGRIAEGLSARALTWADPSFDRLWERTRGRFANTNVRRAEIVNWFCFANADFRKELFGCYQDDELRGYCVVRLNDRNRHGLKVYECMDLWLDPASDDALGALVAIATEHARARGYDLVAVPHFHPTVASGLERLGLLPISSPERREYVKVHGSAAPMTPADSYFVTAQGDNGL